MILGAVIFNGAVVGALVRPLDMPLADNSKVAEDVVSKIMKENGLLEENEIFSIEEEKDKRRQKEKISQNSSSNTVKTDLSTINENHTKRPKFENASTTRKLKKGQRELVPLITVTDSRENTTVMFPDKPTEKKDNTQVSEY